MKQTVEPYEYVINLSTPFLVHWLSSDNYYVFNNQSFLNLFAIQTDASNFILDPTLVVIVKNLK